MASFFLLLLPLLSTISATSAINNTSSSVATIPPAFSQETPPQQLRFNAIIGAGDFNILAEAGPSMFPLAATLLIPNDTAFLNGTSPPSTQLFTYHIITRRFSSSELLLFPTGAYLPTLLPGNTLLITNNSTGATLTRPGLFRSSVVRVHDVGDGVLEYTMLGRNLAPPENSLETVNITLAVTEVSMARREGAPSFVLAILLTVALHFMGFTVPALVGIVWGIFFMFYEHRE